MLKNLFIFIFLFYGVYPFKMFGNNYQVQKLNFPEDKNIIKCQFPDKDIGFVLTNEAKFYRVYQGNNQLINTPDEIQIKKFFFKNEKEGIVVGIPKSIVNELTASQRSEQHEDLTTSVIIFGIIIIIFGGIIFGVYKSFTKWRWKILYATIPLVVLMAYCIWHRNSITKEELSFNYGQHVFLGKTEYNSKAAITTDGGNKWSVFDIKTNFELTDIACVNNNYLISSFASKSHEDGDIWLVREDTLQAMLLGVYRGLTGIRESIDKNQVVAYGTDRTVMITGKTDELKGTKGEIILFDIFDTKAKNCKVIDIQGKEIVISLDMLQDGTIWIITQSRKILKYNRQNWETIENQEVIGANKIIFLDSHNGYILNKKGKFFYSVDGGVQWNKFEFEDKNVIIKDIFKLNNILFASGENGFCVKINKIL
ncbi:MAG: hypothetical protein WC614_06930 [bacterium]